MEPKIVQCPECDKDVQLDANGEGSCAACGLDVGIVYARHRLDRAVSKLNKSAEEKEKPADTLRKKGVFAKLT